MNKTISKIAMSGIDFPDLLSTLMRETKGCLVGLSSVSWGQTKTPFLLGRYWKIHDMEFMASSHNGIG